MVVTGRFYCISQVFTKRQNESLVAQWPFYESAKEHFIKHWVQPALSTSATGYHIVHSKYDDEQSKRLVKSLTGIGPKTKHLVQPAPSKNATGHHIDDEQSTLAVKSLTGIGPKIEHLVQPAPNKSATGYGDDEQSSRPVKSLTGLGSSNESTVPRVADTPSHHQSVGCQSTNSLAGQQSRAEILVEQHHYESAKGHYMSQGLATKHNGSLITRSGKGHFTEYPKYYDQQPNRPVNENLVAPSAQSKSAKGQSIEHPNQRLTSPRDSRQSKRLLEIVTSVRRVQQKSNMVCPDDISRSSEEPSKLQSLEQPGQNTRIQHPVVDHDKLPPVCRPLECANTEPRAKPDETTQNLLNKSPRIETTQISRIPRSGGPIETPVKLHSQVRTEKTVKMQHSLEYPNKSPGIYQNVTTVMSQRKQPSQTARMLHSIETPKETRRVHPIGARSILSNHPGKTTQIHHSLQQDNNAPTMHTSERPCFKPHEATVKGQSEVHTEKSAQMLHPMKTAMVRPSEASCSKAHEATLKGQCEMHTEKSAQLYHSMEHPMKTPMVHPSEASGPLKGQSKVCTEKSAQMGHSI